MNKLIKLIQLLAGAPRIQINKDTLRWRLNEILMGIFGSFSMLALGTGNTVPYYVALGALITYLLIDDKIEDTGKINTLN